MPVNVLDDNDGIVDQDTNGKNKGEQGYAVEVKPQAQEANKVTVSVMITAVPTIMASRQPMVSNTSRMTDTVANVSF